jgi:hypothetical protein
MKPKTPTPPPPPPSPREAREDQLRFKTYLSGAFLADATESASIVLAFRKAGTNEETAHHKKMMLQHADVGLATATEGLQLATALIEDYQGDLAIASAMGFTADAIVADIHRRRIEATQVQLNATREKLEKILALV